MNSAKLDEQFRKLGYFLYRAPQGTRRRHEDPWEVRNLRTLSLAWTCANLPEVRSLLRAVQERESRGGRARATVYWDGDGWACADEPGGPYRP